MTDVTEEFIDNVHEGVSMCYMWSGRCESCPYKNQRNCKKHMCEDLTKVLAFAKNVLATLNAFLNKGE